MPPTDLRAILERVGVSQSAFARRLKVNRRTFTRYLDGTRKPSAEAIRLAQRINRLGYWTRPARNTVERRGSERGAETINREDGTA